MFPVEKGVRQGCIGSPSLTNLYTENMRQEVLEPLEPGEAFEFEGRFDLFSVGALEPDRYADDSVLLLNFKDGLRSYLNRLNVVSKKYGLQINAAKTKVMVIEMRTYKKLGQRIS